MKFSTDLLNRSRSLLREGIKSCLFSEGTYQVEVEDQGIVYWPFLQLDDVGDIQDSFCSCSEGDGCLHLGSAYLSIMDGKELPLHVRFHQSLFHKLCQIAATRAGFGAKVEEKDGAIIVEDEMIITPKGQKGAQILHTLFFEREKETEETSLKFSNLSDDEITNWKKGNPSTKLRYELSYWSDLAKQMMILHEKTPCEIEFFPVDKLPVTLTLHFADFSASFSIENKDWECLIPPLAPMKTPLPVHEYAPITLQAMRYLPEKRAIHFEGGQSQDDENAEAIPLENYFFHPKAGFYPKKIDPILQRKVIDHDHIARFLQRYSKLLFRYLIGTTIHAIKQPLFHSLFFDEEGNLHIESYLFEKGDLQRPLSEGYGYWVYIEDKGFYPIEKGPFDDLEILVMRNEISDFINKHRVWLGQFEGFQIHLSGIDSCLSYTLGENALIFSSTLEFEADAAGMLNLGEWIFIKGKGFYPKKGTKSSALLRPGLKIPIDEIESFIERSRDDLEAVPNFFSSTSPLLSASLEIRMNEKGKICVKPQFTFSKLFAKKTIRLFRHYSFVEGEGFCPIPSKCRLPEPYTQEVTIDKKDESSFLTLTLQELIPYVSRIDPRLRQSEHLKLSVNSVSKEIGQWRFDLSYRSEFGEISIRDLYDAIHKKRPYLMTEAGLLYFHQPRFNWLRSLNEKSFTENGAVILTTLEWIRLSVFEKIALNADEKSLEKLATLSQLKSEEKIVLDGFKSDLRPYQKVGVQWLWFLYTQGLSGLLSDEMGLGKTHQAMGLLAAVKNAHAPEKKMYLIVCPTSVIFHWEELLKRFLPGIRVRLFYGLDRTLRGFSRGKEVLLTSYGTLRSERKALEKFNFEVVIFDEIQVAKNAFSQTHQVLKKLNAKMKLGLSGTPIENRLLELKALFDVIIPGYLPGETLYKQLFVVPIEKRGDEEKSQLLRDFVRPFILRRKKDDVLFDLPEKIEEISYAPLSKAQKKLYKDVFYNEKQNLVDTIRDETTPVPYIHIFSLFNKLKQICDHPSLLEGGKGRYDTHESGKWELFTELLFEARSSGRKIVIFSQYLGMLDLFKQYFQDMGIAFAEIRGATKDRREEVTRFNTDPNCEVFIGTLQAAGVGIDLIAASVVIHYDRWWNPAKENQATDRVHRIGQNRGVQVFKMVSKHTIEEHIHAMIDRKLALLHDVIGYDDQDQLKQLSRDELIELISQIEKDLN